MNTTHFFSAAHFATILATATFAEGFSDPGFPQNYTQYEQINMFAAWELQDQFAADTIKVGVVDTGVKDIDDLAEIIYDGMDFWKFEGDDSRSIWNDDVVGHGTKAASVIGAIANNGKGIAGVARKVKIAALQVSVDETSSLSPGAIAEAITYANQHQIPIVNFSGYGNKLYEERTEAIKNYYGLVVECAGNEKDDLNLYPKYPVVEKLPNMVIVGGTDANMDNYYNYGAEFVDIGAPALGVITLDPQGNAKPTNGTSFSAPMVSGVLAAMLSINPKLTSAELKTMLLNSAKKIEKLEPYYRDGNFLDAYAALKAAAESAGHSVSPILAGKKSETPQAAKGRFSVFVKGNSVFIKDNASGKVFDLKGGVK